MYTVNEQVARLFIATDQKDWNTVLEVFSDQVELDYSSMTGNPSAVISKQDIVDSWKGILPGFDFTHHQIGNVIVNIEDTVASVFVYGTATHFLEDENGNIWTVVGSYDFDLVLQDDWKITSMKFNFKYQDGNTSLPKRAIENVEKENV